MHWTNGQHLSHATNELSQIEKHLLYRNCHCLGWKLNEESFLKHAVRYLVFLRVTVHCTLYTVHCPLSTVHFASKIRPPSALMSL
jgi:hypothetical protein